MKFCFIPLDTDVITSKVNGTSEEEKVKHYNPMGSHLGTFMLHKKL